MVKKLLAAFVAVALVFAPAGNFVFQAQDQQVSAKGGYRSGVKSFNSNKSNNNSLFQNRQQNRSNTQNAANASRGFTSGGFMRGMIFGGLSGLLFGSLLSQMGGFGMVAGLLINVLAIVAIIALIRYLIVSFTGRSKRRKNEDMNSWKRL